MFGALTEFATMSDWRLIALATACLGVSLLAHPDSYAELGGTNFQTATAMGAAGRNSMS